MHILICSPCVKYILCCDITSFLGTGLFLASGGSIAVGGPGGALAAYTIIGTMVYFIMTSLGEMASFMPISGSFNTYAKMFVDPALGFALGWNYWVSCCDYGITKRIITREMHTFFFFFGIWNTCLICTPFVIK